MQSSIYGTASFPDLNDPQLIAVCNPDPASNPASITIFLTPPSIFRNVKVTCRNCKPFNQRGVAMGNPEHLEILKQGVRIWNKWREENPTLRPDLTGGDLSGAVLCHANLPDTAPDVTLSSSQTSVVDVDLDL
jgi:hypothetical protein